MSLGPSCGPAWSTTQSVRQRAIPSYRNTIESCYHISDVVCNVGGASFPLCCSPWFREVLVLELKPHKAKDTTISCFLMQVSELSRSLKVDQVARNTSLYITPLTQHFFIIVTLHCRWYQTISFLSIHAGHTSNHHSKPI